MTKSLKGSFEGKNPIVFLESIGAPVIHQMANSYGSPSANPAQDAYFEELMKDFVARKGGSALLQFLDQCTVKVPSGSGCSFFRSSHTVTNDVFDVLSTAGRNKLSDFCRRENVPKVEGVSMHWYTGPRAGAGPQ